jgi:hypothetical protein
LTVRSLSLASQLLQGSSVNTKLAFTPDHCGSGLAPGGVPTMAAYHSTEMLTDRSLSLASQLLQGIFGELKIGVHTGSLWERACPGWRSDDGGLSFSRDVD